MIYHFYIELLESVPLVWRRMVVPADYTLYQLHMTIQGAFGWENSHLFQFSESGIFDMEVYEEIMESMDSEKISHDALTTPMKKIFYKKGQHFVYVYDFGDAWAHRLTLEKVEAKNLDGPWCLDGAGACPPEDVGGIYGYREMLEVLKKPHHKERARYIEWLGLVPGEKWAAHFCSIREVNKRLALLDFDKFK